MIVTPATGMTDSWTLIVNVANAAALSWEMTTIVAVPTVSGVTIPSLVTEATAGAFEDQRSALFVAFSGKTVA